MNTILIFLLKWLTRHFSRPIHRYSGVFQSFNNDFAYSERETILLLAFEYIKHARLDGDYLEFGVWEGKTFSAAYHFSRNYGLDHVRLFAFDSFEGLPAPTGTDAEGFKHFDQGEYQCTQAGFEKNLQAYGVDLRAVHIIPGWYHQTLIPENAKNISLEKAAIAWIDCDLYESTTPVLDFIRPYLQEGSILIFDDWFCYRGDPDRGEQGAFRDWLIRNPELQAIPFRKFGWHGNSFIIREDRLKANSH